MEGKRASCHLCSVAPCVALCRVIMSKKPSPEAQQMSCDFPSCRSSMSYFGSESNKLLSLQVTLFQVQPETVMEWKGGEGAVDSVVLAQSL